MRIPLRVHCQQPLPGNAAWVITERAGHLVVYLAPDVPEDSPIEQQFVRQALRAWRGRRGKLLALLPLTGGAWRRPKAKHAAVGGVAAAAVIAAGVAFAAMQLGPETPAKRPPAVSAPQVDPTTRPPDRTPPSKPPRSGPPADGAPVADPSRPAASSPARTLRPRHHRPTHGHSRQPTRPPADPPHTPAGPPVVGTPPSQPEPSRSCHLVQVHLDLGLATVRVCL